MKLVYNVLKGVQESSYRYTNACKIWLHLLQDFSKSIANFKTRLSSKFSYCFSARNDTLRTLNFQYKSENMRKTLIIIVEVKPKIYAEQ